MAFILDNELRVFASRSRCKNSVGLNALEPRVQLRLMEFSVGIGRWRRRQRTGGRLRASPWSSLRPSRLRARGQWSSFRADRAGVWRRRAKRMRGMSEACEDDLELVSGERVARHGPWARFGESWRTNRRRPLRQQGQTRGSSDVFGSADGSAASAPIWPRGCIVCRSRRSSRRARAASLRLAGCQRPK